MKIAFLNSGSPAARSAQTELEERYGSVPPEECDVIVPLGGDGFVLYCLHQYLELGKPIYGMNRGTIGFLLNEYATDDLTARIAAAKEEVLHPLRMEAEVKGGKIQNALAFNEVSLLRSSRQSANLRILINGNEELDKLICDGALVSTPAGSTAYNLSVHGPVVPLGARLIALTSISAFRPRRWGGALLPQDAIVRIENLDPEKRPVSASADQTEVEDVVAITISQVEDGAVTMLFDAGHSLNERILREQFAI
jgi:NAD+ kinase